MAKSLKYFFLLVLIAAIGFGIWKFKAFFSGPTVYAETSSEIILERLEKVNKLVTAEAYYSEVYDYKDYYYYDFSPFRKKALIRVKAKVSIGYNFDAIDIKADDLTRTLRIRGFPPPEILSIDHDLDYYDLSQGTFNSFSEEDYNKINKNAKDFIREKANDKDIFKEAADQKEELLQMFDWMLKAAGWELIIEDPIVLKN